MSKIVEKIDKLNTDIKQVIIVRRDLQMSIGKAGSQIAHASLAVFTNMMSKEEKTIPVFDTEKSIMKPMDVVEMKMFFPKYSPIIKWLNDEFTKIVVGCNSEEELKEFYERAVEAGLPASIIQDSGHTVFKLDCPDCLGGGANLRDLAQATNLKSTIGFCTKCNGTGKINNPTFTTAAIGPDYAFKIDPITRGLRLL